MQSAPIFLIWVIGLVFAQYVFVSIRLFISFDAIGVQLPIWAYVMLVPTTSLISFLSLTPGNLGLREWVIGTISAAIGIDFRKGIFAGTIDRAILMGCTFLFGSLALVIVWLNIRKTATTHQHPNAKME